MTYVILFQLMAPITTRVPYEMLRQPGNLTGSFPALLWQISNAVLPRACEIYRGNPNVGFQFIPGGSSTPLGQLQRAFMDNACAPYGGVFPAEPSYSPYGGGQCPTQYRVTFAGTITGGNPTNPNINSFVDVFGKVKGIRGYFTGAGEYKIDVIGGSAADSNVSVAYNGVTYSGAQSNNFRFSNIRIVSVVRRDGGADNCGDPQAPVYPPVSQPINVNIPINLPSGITVNIPANIQFNADVNIPIRVNVAPNIKLDFDFGGVNLTVGEEGDSGEPVDLQPVLDAIAGVQDTLGTQTNPKIDGVQDTLNNTTNPKIDGVQDTAEGIKLDTQAIITLINEGILPYLVVIRKATVEDIPKTLAEIIALINALDFDCVCPEVAEEKQYTYTRRQLATGQTGEVNLTNTTLGEPWGIELRLTKIPANAKREIGTENQDVLYAGWSTFVCYGTALAEPRLPIHFRFNWRFVPEKAIGLFYALKEGYSGTVHVVYRKELEETP